MLKIGKTKISLDYIRHALSLKRLMGLDEIAEIDNKFELKLYKVHTVSGVDNCMSVRYLKNDRTDICIDDKLEDIDLVVLDNISDVSISNMLLPFRKFAITNVYSINIDNKIMDNMIICCNMPNQVVDFNIKGDNYGYYNILGINYGGDSIRLHVCINGMLVRAVRIETRHTVGLFVHDGQVSVMVKNAHDWIETVAQDRDSFYDWSVETRDDRIDIDTLDRSKCELFKHTDLFVARSTSSYGQICITIQGKDEKWYVLRLKH